MPRLLIDTDAYVRLGYGDCLKELCGRLGASWEDCRHLPALPHQLSRGALARKLGPERAATLRSKLAGLRPLATVAGAAADDLAPINDMDAGEVQLFAAAAADPECLVVTNDKRAIHALSQAPHVAASLAGRVVLTGPALIELLDAMGVDWVRNQLAGIQDIDTALVVCFSPGNPSPGESLSNYLQGDLKTMPPRVLWLPASQTGGQGPMGGGTSPSSS